MSKLPACSAVILLLAAFLSSAKGQFEVMHHCDVIMSAMASQINCVCSSVCSGADQRKHQSSASQASVRGIHRWPVDSPHKGPIMKKMFPFDDVIMECQATKLYRNFQNRYTVFTKSFFRIIRQYVWWFAANHQTFWKNHETFQFKYSWKSLEMFRQYVWWFVQNHRTFCKIISNVW